MAGNVSGEGAAPFRIHFTGYTPQTKDRLAANVKKNLIYPEVEYSLPHNRPLAICGGSPSIAQVIDILKEWPGDIWAINLTADWLCKNGIDSTLYTVDASDAFNEISSPKNIKNCIFSSWCDPNILAAFENVRIFHMEPLVPGGIIGGTTSAVSAPLLALRMGYTDVTFFGCECSFVDDDHIDRNENRPEQIIVKANGKLYKTRPDLYIQAQELGKILKEFPQAFKENSGGLLRAMMLDDQWGVVGVSEALQKHFDEVNALGIDVVAERYKEHM